MDSKLDDSSVGFDRGVAGLPTLGAIAVAVAAVVAHPYSLISVLR